MAAGYYHTIATHVGPHLDERFGRYELRKYGEGKFPGVSRSRTIFWDTGGSTPDGRPAKDWLERGYIPLGVGGGPFDEHSENGKNGQNAACAATLVADYLEIRDRPELERLLCYTLQADSKSGQEPFSLASMIKSFNDFPSIGVEEGLRMFDLVFEAICRAGDAVFHEINIGDKPDVQQIVAEWMKIRKFADNNPACEKILRYISRIDQNPFGLACLVKVCHREGSGMSVEEVVDFVYHILDAVYAGQEDFQEALAEFEKKGGRETVNIRDGKQLRIAWIMSGRKQAQQAARFKTGADVVIVRKLTGHTAILANVRSKLMLGQVAAILRRKEADLRGVGYILWDDLRVAGQLFQNWFLPVHEQQVLNGSTTAKGVEPTLLEMKNILESVRIGLSCAFHPKRYKDCCQGKCTSNEQNPCPWFGFGLDQCRNAMGYGK